MAITWNIDETRATIRAQMAEANRLDEVIDDLSAETSAALARAEAAEAAETSLRNEWRDYTRAKVQEFADMQRELNSTRAEVARLRLERDDARKANELWRAEAERLRSQVVTLEAQLQEVRTEYRVACEDFNELLEKASDW